MTIYSRAVILLLACRTARSARPLARATTVLAAELSGEEDRPLFPEPEHWKLFPDGKIPNETRKHMWPEAFIKVPEPGSGPWFFPLADPTGTQCSQHQPGHWYYNVSVPELVPFEVDNPLGTMVVIPGGGNRFLAWEKEGTEIARWLNSIGLSAYVLKYRVPDCEPHKTPKLGTIDGQRAVALVRHRQHELGLKNKIGMIGFSAGGALVARVSHLNGKRWYAKIDEVDDYSSKLDFAMLVYGSGSPQDAAHAAPTFAVSTDNDKCVKSVDVTAYWTALRKHNISAELHVFQEGHHGYGDCKVWTWHREQTDVCAWVLVAKMWLYSRLAHDDNYADVLGVNESGEPTEDRDNGDARTFPLIKTPPQQANANATKNEQVSAARESETKVRVSVNVSVR